MNTGILTGYLIGNGEPRYTPKGDCKYTFDVVVDVGGGHVPWQCVIEDQSVIEKAKDLLTSGRACILKFELGGAPVQEHGRTKYWSRFLRIVSAEFPNRAAVKKDGEKADEKTPGEAASA